MRLWTVIVYSCSVHIVTYPIMRFIYSRQTALLAITSILVWFKYDLGQKYCAPQVRPNQGSNSWPPDYDSRPTFNVTETPALTTRPSVTFKQTQMVRIMKTNDVLPHLNILRFCDGDIPIQRFTNYINVNVNAEVYSLKSRWVKQTLQFTSLVLELSLTWSNPSGENSEHFLQLMPFTIFPIFVPPGTHYCWMDRGSMVWYVFVQHLSTWNKL